MSKTRVLISLETDPYLNQAFEEILFSNTLEASPILFLWKNSDSVVFGKHQVPWAEFDVLTAFEEGIRLVRRTSGGGTVYHDLGNLNFSFVCHKENLDLEKNFSVLLHALKSLGIKAFLNERRDITVEGFKVSGSAYRFSRGKTIHHGTLLISSDLLRLRKILMPVCEVRVVSHAVRSYPSQVANLHDFVPVSENEVVEAFVDSFARTYGKPEIEHICRKNISGVEKVSARFSSWDWIFGNTPQFQMELGNSVFSVKNGVIVRIQMNDKFSGDGISHLLGSRLDPALFRCLLEVLKEEGYCEKG